MNLKHRFLGYDEGRQTLGIYDTQDNTWGWVKSMANKPLARDLQKLDNNRALVGYNNGYFEINIHYGEILKVCDRWSGVTSCRRLENGHTLITGIDLDKPGISILTLDESDNIIKSVNREGEYVRLMRPTVNDTYLLGLDNHFLETDTNLLEIRRLTAKGFQHAWLANRDEYRHTLVSAGYGAFLALFDETGKMIKKIGAKGDVPEEVNPFFYASFEILPYGGFLVANWQGHGKHNGSKGKQLVEFDCDGNYVGSWSSPEKISSLQGILLI